MTTENTKRSVPEALRLAAWLTDGAWTRMTLGDVEAAGRELRRLHALATPTAASVASPLPDGMVTCNFPIIAMGHGKVEVGDGTHDGLPCLWFGNDGQGLGFERERNGPVNNLESLAVFTFANIQGLEAIELAVARLRHQLAPLPAGGDLLQELHDALYSAQRVAGAPEFEAITKARILLARYRAAIATPQPAASVTSGGEADIDKLPERTRAAYRQCKVVSHLARSLAEVHEAQMLILARTNSPPTEIIGESSSALMEILGDWLSEMDAVTDEDEWTDSIFDEAQRLWPVGVAATAQPLPRTQADPSWCAYVAGIIETYLGFNKPQAERERAIADIIKGRLPFLAAQPITLNAPIERDPAKEGRDFDFNLAAQVLAYWPDGTFKELRFGHWPARAELPETAVCFQIAWSSLPDGGAA